jgi:flagellar biosynthesis protein FlhG
VKILTVASGKGGVGKTTMSANLGVALASLGQRVVLVDGDLGLANLDVALGLSPEITMQHVIEGIVPMEQALVQGPGGVRVMAGSSGASSMLRLSRKRLDAFLCRLDELRDSADIVILDASAGADARVMSFLKVANEAVIVTTPDPSSIVDCYSTAKVLHRYKRDAFISILMNRVEDGKQALNAFETIRSAALKFLGKRVNYLGYVRDDKQAAQIARARRPFVLVDPLLPASQDVKTLAEALVENRCAQQSLGEAVNSSSNSGVAA